MSNERKLHVTKKYQDVIGYDVYESGIVAWTKFVDGADCGRILSDTITGHESIKFAWKKVQEKR